MEKRGMQTNRPKNKKVNVYVLHPRDNIDRLYVSRKERGRRHASIKDYVDAQSNGLKNYIEKNKKKIIHGRK